MTPTRLLALLVTTAALAACGGSASGSGSPDDRVDVAVGFYPYEFVTSRVGGDDVTVTNLTKPGGEPHDLELTARQVVELSGTDLVVYSRGFQPAVDEAVEQQAEDKALDVLTAVELRAAPEGGSHEEEGEPAEDAPEDDAHADEGLEGQDPHVWLDPVRLATIADAVAARLSEVDPDSAEAYERRAADLRAELESLDDELRTGLASCARKEVVTSHDAFGYLTGAYGLEQVPIAGLSPEDEASPGRLAEIAVEAEQKGVTTIFFEELVSPKVAESLAREVGAEATVLTPLEGAPESGDYVSAMQENLATLRTALDCP
jgi:zinc transport system substrate-binding protein